MGKVKEEFLKIIEEVRSLSDIDFALQKENFAEKIKDIVDVKKEVNLDKRIAKFLLNPQIIPVLEEKLLE